MEKTDKKLTEKRALQIISKYTRHKRPKGGVKYHR